MKGTLALIFATFSLSAFAVVPEYQKPTILARANVTDGFNIPPMSFLNNTCPVINNRGDVTFKLMSTGEENAQAVWFKSGSDENGKVIYTAPDMRFLTDPSLNDQGKIAFNLYDEGITDGVFTLDGMSGKVEQTITPDSDEIAFYTYAQLTTDGRIYFRGTDQNNIRTFYKFDGKLKKVITEGANSFGQKTSYLFKPTLNDNGAMSFKRRLGDVGAWDESQGDEILLLKPNGTSYESIVIAKDKDSDSASAFKGFTNATSLSKNGNVAFVAYLDDGARAVILYKDGTLKNVATEKVDQISEIELFSPKVNEQGLVVFRAKDENGKRGIYIADASGVKRIIGEGDEIETDLGLGKILSNPNYPGFGGEVDMNDQGEIVFYCLVVGAKDNKEWGSAVFRISPKISPQM